MSIDREESLFFTVSENHTPRKYPEYIQTMSEPYRELGGIIAAYEGIILGGCDKLFGLDELNLWLRRHRFAAYNMELLLPLTRLCLEYVVRKRLSLQRPGIAVMAEQAARQLLEEDPLELRYSSRGWMIIYWLKLQFPKTASEECDRILRNLDGFDKAVNTFTELMEGSLRCEDAKAIVLQAVMLYKEVFTKYFAPSHADDEVAFGELTEVPDAEIDPDSEEELQPREYDPELKYETASPSADDGIVLSDAELAAIPDYLAKHFGPSYQTERAIHDIQQAVCTGIHEGRKLLFTDGLPAEAYEENSPRAISLKTSRDRNLQMFNDHKDSAQQGIRSIEQAFRNALNLRSEPEIYRSDRGVLVNNALWKVGRCEDPQLFHKIFHHDQSAIVVELLIDASGSQICRQSMVALQSYMFSAALSRIGIPHRVFSYCTYGDHTVMRRFRDYDNPPEADQKILEYRATSNNRDGLAIAAAGLDLLNRQEGQKIVIVFSDGLPNDMVSGRVRAGSPGKYVGSVAIRDTCFQIRKLRRQGVQVIGIFLGNDDELENERIIYGSSFLRIQRVEDFSLSAGKRLSEALLAL